MSKDLTVRLNAPNECNKTMKSVGSRNGFSEFMDSQSICKSNNLQSKRTSTKPFNLSQSNYRRKPRKDTSTEQNKFKAKKIPKTHKIPFVVYHSTKSLTAFKNVDSTNKTTSAN